MNAQHTQKLDRFQLVHAVEKVEGYFLPRPHEHADTRPAFERARAECAEAFRAQANEIERLEWEDFKSRAAIAKATGATQ